MELDDDALVLTLLPHGEHAAVVRFLTFAHGLRSGYVPGARSTRRRAILAPGNHVRLRLRARSDSQLATASAELVESRALLAFEPLPALALSYLAALAASTLVEAVPQPRLASALDALLSGLVAGLDPLATRAGIARFELLLLEESGFGLDLSACALGGGGDLAFVSPKSGRAVSRQRAAGQPWAGRLLVLPRFLVAGGSASPDSAAAALTLTGHFLRRHWPDSAFHPLRERMLGSAASRP